MAIATLLEYDVSTDLDAGRFRVMTNALPADLLGKSATWLNWFFQQEKNTDPYAVGSKGAILPESLAHSGVYRAGEVAMLTREQAANLPMDEGPRELPTPQEMEESVMTSKPSMEKPLFEGEKPVVVGDCEVMGYRPG